MGWLFGFGIGFAVASLAWVRRSVEQRRAFNALAGQNEMLRWREIERERELVRVNSEAAEMRRVIQSSGPVVAPARNENRMAANG